MQIWCLCYVVHSCNIMYSNINIVWQTYNIVLKYTPLNDWLDPDRPEGSLLEPSALDQQHPSPKVCILLQHRFFWSTRHCSALCALCAYDTKQNSAHITLNSIGPCQHYPHFNAVLLSLQNTLLIPLHLLPHFLATILMAHVACRHSSCTAASTAAAAAAAVRRCSSCAAPQVVTGRASLKSL